MQDRVLTCVGCYVRVSTENQLENYSIDEQVERLKSYCNAKDWSIYKIYTDGGFSGGNTQRPALQQLLNDIKLKKLDLVVVYKLDRLSRSQKDTLLLIEDEFLAHQVNFVSINENFDTSTPFGRAMIGILSVFAQLEKDQITERFTMGRIGRSKAGYYHGGSMAPTGYTYTNGNLLVDDYGALQVKEVYEKFLNGESINSIKNSMHAKYSNWTSASLVSNVLKNTVYIGKVKFKGIESDGKHKPIISEQTFFRVQELINSPERAASITTLQKTPFRANYMLSSLIHCAHCKARYSANHGFYKCYSRAKSSKQFITDPNCMNDNWVIEALDDLIIKELKKMRYNAEYLAGIIKKGEAHTDNKDDATIRARITELDGQVSKIIDLYQVDSISIEAISKRIETLHSEKSALLKSMECSGKSNNGINQYFKSGLDKMDVVLSSESVAEKRMFVSTLIESIWIDGDKVNIKWRI